jgi:hypothetical protein
VTREDGEGGWASYFWAGAQADAILAMRWLRLSAAPASSYCLARRGMEQRLGPGGLVALRQVVQV